MPYCQSTWLSVCGHTDSVCPSASLWLNISETKGDSGLFPIESLQESVKEVSNGHVTDVIKCVLSYSSCRN